jgi:hypothetical protein
LRQCASFIWNGDFWNLISEKFWTKFGKHSELVVMNKIGGHKINKERKSEFMYRNLITGY